MIEGIIAAVIGVLAGVGGTVVYDRQRKAGGKHKADQAIAEAKTKASDIVLKAKDEALKLAEDAKKEEADRRKTWEKTENRLADRETNLDKKLDELDKRAESLRAQEDEVEDLKNEIRDIRTRQQEKLEKIAGLKKKEAAEKLLEMTERDIKQDLTGLVAKLQNEAKENAEEKAQLILVSAMERMSSEVTAERTVTAIKLTDDEMKGRIIGKEGRNIQALQRATGVDILVDDTPGMIGAPLPHRYRVTMPHPFLHSSWVDALHQGVRAEGVPELVHGDSVLDTRPLGRTAESTTYIIIRLPTAT